MKTLISMCLGVLLPFIMTDDSDSLISRIGMIPDTTISGVVKKDSSLMVTVKSGYSFGTGTAKIKFVGKDSIYFEFITTPNDEYWIPNKVTLVKQTLKI